jgi:hypothetical protein
MVSYAYCYQRRAFVLQGILALCVWLFHAGISLSACSLKYFDEMDGNGLFAMQTLSQWRFCLAEMLACGQGIHTVIDAADGGMVHPGCDTIFGGETISENEINEFCSLCGDCVIEYTGGLCPMTLCSKALLNGPCGGADKGMCEVDKNRKCGWVMIYDRLKKLDRLDLLVPYREPKNHARSSKPRSLTISPEFAIFRSQDGEVTASNRG